MISHLKGLEHFEHRAKNPGGNWRSKGSFIATKELLQSSGHKSCQPSLSLDLISDEG
jgi:hypothetical protein